jgi:hypothetical protein
MWESNRIEWFKRLIGDGEKERERIERGIEGFLPFSKHCLVFLILDKSHHLTV